MAISLGRLSPFLMCICCAVLLSCDGVGKTVRQDDLTTEQVAAALKSGREFCVIGTDTRGEEVRLVGTPKWLSDMYQREKFQILFSTQGGSVDSEFYNDDVQALKSLTDRGASKFQNCPEPMPID